MALRPEPLMSTPPPISAHIPTSDELLAHLVDAIQNDGTRNGREAAPKRRGGSARLGHHVAGPVTGCR
jgi:hypothetical protein